MCLIFSFFFLTNSIVFANILPPSDYADVDLVAPIAHGADHAVQQLTGRAHEGYPLFVLVLTWAFTLEEEH